MALNKEEIAELRADIAAARKRDMNFAFCVGKTPETSILMCHKIKQANALHKLAKKAGETNKVASGVMNVNGKVVALTCLTDPPSSIARKVKLFLKTAGLSMKIVILNADGEELETDGDEDETADGTENTVAQDTNDAESSDGDAQLAALKAALVGAAGNVKNIKNPDLRTKLGAAIKSVAADITGGNADKAQEGLNAITAALERLSADGQNADEVKTSPDGSENDAVDDDREWRDVASALEPQVLAALKAGHAEATKIRAVWGFAQEKAQAGDFKVALQAAGRLAAMLQSAPAGGVADAPPQNAVAFQRSRILWIDAKRAMRSGLDTFRNAVAQQSSEDEDQSEITDAVDTLVAEFDAFDTRLEDILDEITQTPEGPERARLKSQASRVIGTYLAVLEKPFFQIVDNNPFVSVNVAARGRSSLSLVQSTLV